MQINEQNGQSVSTYRTVLYLYIPNVCVSKANLVVLGGLKSNIQK